MKILNATPGKIFAYKDKNGTEILLGTVLYLGKNDNSVCYYEVEKPIELDENGSIIVDNSTENVVQ